MTLWAEEVGEGVRLVTVQHGVRKTTGQTRLRFLHAGRGGKGKLDLQGQNLHRDDKEG